MTVLFISDFGLQHSSGGAQVSNRIIAEKGRELGHEIEFYHFDSSPTLLLRSYDLVISSNLEKISRESEKIFDLILNHPNHVRLEHDSCSYLSIESRKRLFGSSKINFFLSDFHLEFFQKLYGDIFPNPKIIYDPIDTSLFFNEGCEKEYDVVYAGYLHPLKGVFNLFSAAKENQDRKFDVFGWSSDEGLVPTLKSLPNITIHELVPHNKISEIYKKTKSIFHSPIVNEPFCRMVGEAMLCGCDFMGNSEKIGSYLEFKKFGSEEFSARCQNASKDFWEEACGE